MAMPKLLSPDSYGSRRWYYDSCTLDRMEAYSDILNIQQHSVICMTSHLGLGEAHGTCFEKGNEKLDAFLELQVKIKPYLRVVGNDDIEKIFDELSVELPRLTFTDKVHLATAIKYKCEVFKTTDGDLTGLPKKKVLEIAQKHGCPDFAISLLKE